MTDTALLIAFTFLGFIAGLFFGQGIEMRNQHYRRRIDLEVEDFELQVNSAIKDHETAAVGVEQEWPDVIGNENE